MSKQRLTRGTGLVGALAVGGKTGATAASGLAGGTASGAPATGTFAVGDVVVDHTGALWVCTVAGTPGTWAQAATALAGTQAITSNSADALDVGLNGTTHPALQVDASTALSATGVKIKRAAAAAGAALSTISSGTDESLTIDAKGAGTLTLQGTATGGVRLARQATLSKTLICTPAVVTVLALDVTAGVVHTKAIAADSSFTASGAGTAGQIIILVIAVDGTQRTATFSTNLNASATMVIPANKVGCIQFVSDGVSFREVGRSINA